MQQCVLGLASCPLCPSKDYWCCVQDFKKIESSLYTVPICVLGYHKGGKRCLNSAWPNLQMTTTLCVKLQINLVANCQLSNFKPIVHIITWSIWSSSLQITFIHTLVCFSNLGQAHHQHYKCPVLICWPLFQRPCIAVKLGNQPLCKITSRLNKMFLLYSQD